MKEENGTTLRDIHERLMVIENKFTAMTSFYSEAVSKTLITKEDIQSLKKILDKVYEEPKAVKKMQKQVKPNEVKKKNVRRKK